MQKLVEPLTTFLMANLRILNMLLLTPSDND